MPRRCSALIGKQSILILLAALCGLPSSCKDDSAISAVPSPESFSAAGGTDSGSRPPPSFEIPCDGTVRWFEFTQNGPAAVADPESSSLVPFEPWPMAERATGTVVIENSAVFAVNRRGFLVAEAAPEGFLRLYAVDAEAAVGAYSMGAPVRFGGTAAAILYRDGFFAEPVGSLPQAPMVALDVRNLTLTGDAPAAFASAGASGEQEIDTLELGNDGLWYFRSQAPGQGDAAYFLAESLEGQARRSNIAAYQNSRTPRLADAAPGPLRPILQLWSDGSSHSYAVTVTVADTSQDGRRAYLASSDPRVRDALVSGRSDPVEAYAFVDGGRAWGILPDGRGLAVGGTGVPSAFALPALPGGFVYTGLAAVGDHLLATWEEQDLWAVGSAGILVYPAPR